MKKFKDVWKRIQQVIQVFLGEHQKTAEERQEPKEAVEEWENPFIDDFRELLLQILEQRNLSYKKLRLIVIDTDSPEQSYLEEDDIVRLLEQLMEGLNGLEIVTGRPEYFKQFLDHMYETYGLLVQTYPEKYTGPFAGNLILDLERKTPMEPGKYPKDILYLPIHKKKWEILENSHDSCADSINLDIQIPIGYNIVTVKLKNSELNRNRM